MSDTEVQHMYSEVTKLNEQFVEMNKVNINLRQARLSAFDSSAGEVDWIEKRSINLIIDQSMKLATYLDNLILDVTSHSGSKENHWLKYARNRDVVMILMLGGAKNGKGYELKSRLDDYVDYLNVSSVGEPVPYIENISRSADYDPEEEDFAHRNFKMVHTIRFVRKLSELKITILEMEQAALQGF